MKNPRRSIIPALPVLIVLLLPVAGLTCTTFIAGKGVTEDGSIIFAKTEDDTGIYKDFLWYIPPREHPEGTMIKLVSGNSIPQAEKTYGFFWDQPPGTEYSNAVVNEWGLALGSDACPSREDSIEEVEERGGLVKGGIGWRLRIILAERCRTAREAVQLSAELLDRYGYRGSGRTLNIVGRKEAWMLQMVRGKQYAARRVRDDEVIPLANTYTIHEVDMNDRDNFICSPDLIRYAEKRGWYDPDTDGEFDFARAYADPGSYTDPRNTRRQWIIAKMANRGFSLSLEEADAGKMPVSVKPDRKISLRDAMDIMRTHYEGTMLDDSEDYRRSPHRNSSRPVCTYRTHRTTVIQQREEMPREIGTVIWRALFQPCSSGFVPWYLCATEIPEPFQSVSPPDPQQDLHDFHFNMPESVDQFDNQSASCLFGLMANLVDLDYGNVIDYVRGRWGEFEKFQFEMQGPVEKTALKLYRDDREASVRYLSDYSCSRALRSLEVAESILRILKTRTWKARHGKEMKEKPAGAEE
ncbi:MAG: dipeptidase [Candidatus Krumholzibacteriota bacterium]